MGQLLDDEVTKVDKIAERERALKIGETELKVSRQELATSREKLLIEKQANQKLSLELREKQDRVDQELQQRINNIMENERHDHQRALREAEKEIFDVNKTLATMQALSEKKQKDMIALQQEHKALQKQVQLLFDEKANHTVEMSNKIEQERQNSDLLQRESASQLEEQIEKVRNLEFSLENSRIRARDFEERYNQYRKEI